MRNARGRGHTSHTTTNKGSRPLTPPAGIGRGRHEPSKVKVCESIKGKRLPKRKAPHEKTGKKIRKTMKHTQECPRAPSGHEMCPCTHTP